MGRKKLAQGRRRVLATRVEEELAERAEEAAGEGGLSAWLRGLVESALGETGKVVKVAAERVKDRLDLELKGQAGEDTEPDELDLVGLGAGEEEPDERPRCPVCKAPTAGGDLCVDCLIESENPRGAAS